MEAKSSVAVIDATAHVLVTTIPLPAPSLPMGSVLSPDGNELYVTTGRGDAVAFIDTRTRTVSALVPVGRRPWGIALSPDASLLFTANGASDDVSVIDVRTRRELKRIKVGAGPWGIAIARGR
jgi:YVTN family beta-propeller protein